MTTSTTVHDVTGRNAALRAALPEHLERRTWSRERITRHQRDAARSLLGCALARSRFHGPRIAAAGIDPQRFELGELPQLPVMTKSAMMAAFDDVVTDPRITRARVESHPAATGTETTELLGQYMVLASGGSSGHRGVFVYDRFAAVHYRMGLVRTALAQALAAGPLPPGGLRMTMIGAESGVHATRAVSSLFGGDLDTTTCIPATLPIPEIVARLNTAPPPVLLGYSSVLAVLADERRAGRLRISPRVVRGISEQFPAVQRARVSAAFGVDAGVGYGTSEGLQGGSPPGSDEIVLTSDLAIVELVDADHQPVAPGTESAHVLLTNLYNHTQPLIRYQLTDRMIRLPDATGHGHLRVTISGRAEELLHYGGVVVHPHVVAALLVTEPAVIEYQVAKTPRGVHVDVLGRPSVTLAGRLAEALAAAGVPEAEATVAVVDQLCRDPQSGKAARFHS